MTNIDIYISKFLSGESTTEENQLLESWKKEKPENEKYFNDFVTVWNLSQKSQHVHPSKKIDTDKAWQAIKPRQAPKTTSTKERSMLQRWWSVAASILLLAGLSYLALTQQETSLPMKTIAVSASKIQEVKLPDGSLVTLNKGALLEYPEKFEGLSRTVYLKGEGFFEVESNPKKPFIVDLEKAQVKVLGTSFNIYTHKEAQAIEVTVNSGKVLFSNKKKGNNKAEVILIKGEQATFERKSNTILKAERTNANALAWKTKTFQFDNTPLKEVSAVLQNAFGKKISFKNEETKNCTITLYTQQPQSLDNILETIELTLGVEIDRKNETYWILGKCQ